MTNKFRITLLIIWLSIICHLTNSQNLADYRWSTLDTKGQPTGRHENSFVEYKGKFYLLGGRGINPVDVYDPITNTWEAKSKSPIQIHHFQAVVYNDAIYLTGAMTGSYPKEPALEHIWIYYPETDKWKKGPEIPETRRRGSAGIVIYNDKIYMACGIKIGHTSGTNNYFDSYDLKTGEWKQLTDAPHIRDHVPAIVVDDKLWLIGGRNTSVHFEGNFGAFFNAVEPNVDYYDFKKEQWFTLKEKLPIPTAAGSLVNIGKKLLYIGGEGPQAQAYNNTQCLDLETGKWSQLDTLGTGRHGTGALVYDNKIFIAAGSPVKGGGALTSLEVLASENIK
jgi:N-acetylneuraminic acid mutarotase